MEDLGVGEKIILNCEMWGYGAGEYEEYGIPMYSAV